MATKPLYILVKDCGDGSYSVRYTFNTEWILMMEQKDNDGELDCESAGVDGDGFHYDVLQVPEECTLESLGISYDCARR